MLIIAGIYMSSIIYIYYTKGERRDADEQARRRLTAKVTRKCCA